MSDFLRRLAERATGTSPGVRPSLPPRFAPASPSAPAPPAGGGDAVDPTEWIEIEAPPVPGSIPASPARPTGAPVPGLAPRPSASASGAAADRHGPDASVPPRPRRSQGDAGSSAPGATATGETGRAPAPQRGPSPVASLAGDAAPPAGRGPAARSGEPPTAPSPSPTPPPRPAAERSRDAEPLPHAPAPRPALQPAPTEPASAIIPAAPGARPPLAVPTRRGGDAPTGRTGGSRDGIVPAATAEAGEPRAPAAPVQASRREAEPARPPVIEVTIGRVEVRAVAAPPAAKPARAAAPAPAVSLDDYLRARGGGGR